MARRPAKSSYNADSITRLKGLEGVRVRPGMYVGDTDSRGIMHLVKEVIDNAIDEAVNGHGNIIGLSTDASGTVTVYDTGRGIPTGPHKSDPKLDTLTIIMTELHSGGKLQNTEKNYKTARGTHGVGLAVVNALSEHTTVWTKSSGKWQQQTFAKGKPTSRVVASKQVPKFRAKNWPRGTIVQFKPDLSVFEKGSKLLIKDLHTWLSQLSWFVYGPPKSKGQLATPIRFLLDFNGKVGKIERPSLAKYAYYKAKQLAAEPLVERLQPFVFSSDTCDVLFYPTRHDQMSMYAALSSSETSAGGTHVTALRKAFSTVFDKFKTKRTNFTLDDILTGAIVVCNVKMVNAQFAGQSKERLTSKITSEFSGLEQALQKWCNTNKSAIKTLVARAAELNSLSSDAAIKKRLVSALKTKKNGKSVLPISLISSTTRNREEREMFIVEGTSAGGCFVGETPILLADGKTTRPLHDLVQDWTTNKATDRVMTYDVKHNQSELIKPWREGEVFRGWLSKHTKYLVKVHLSDGQVYTCTPNHRWLLKSGIWRAAKNLQIGDWLRHYSDNEASELRVKHAERYTAAKPVPVYDITVPVTANFCLSSGAVVHNSAKKASDRRYQEIMLLRGKILNVVKAAKDRMTTSQVVLELLQAIGYDPKRDFNKSRRVNRIYLLTDPDPDGSHIKCLLLGLLYTVVPELFREGRVLDVHAPLYSYTSAQARVYGSSLHEVKEQVGNSFNPDRLKRMKGWGEAKPEELEEIAFNPTTRKVEKISIADAAESKRAMMEILGEGAGARRALLGLNG